MLICRTIINLRYLGTEPRDKRKVIGSGESDQEIKADGSVVKLTRHDGGFEDAPCTTTQSLTSYALYTVGVAVNQGVESGLKDG
ncbi:hypothetical protein AFLA_009449 [Aspergillus flavus NRRL3357]|nr:hypothetical protein AFLA_009449 [Aspergillus flavus NRRL3357]